MNYKIIKATKDNIDQVGKLFDLYRQFYKYKSNIKESTNYIYERILVLPSSTFLSSGKIKKISKIVKQINYNEKS